MGKIGFLCGGSALAVAASLCASDAVAATAVATAEATQPSAVTEITVIATKREESIQRVPVAITAYTSQQRQLLGIQKVQDLSDFTPSLTWTDTDDRAYIRGIGRNSDNLNNTSGVAIYYNGVYYGANAAIELQKDTLFIANVEVDSGPQNTLHGSNADGGVINFIQQRPTNSYYFEGRAGAENYNEYFGEFVVSGPLNDHLKFRFGANYTTQRGGFYNNLDGRPQGGNLVLGGGGDTHYEEFQLQGNWSHFDIWAMVSSGEFTANNRQGTNVSGEIPDIPVLANGLTASGYNGLCGLPGVAGSPGGNDGCDQGPAGPFVLSVSHLPFTANQFPLNNPGIVNPRDFIQEANSRNDQQRNYQVTVDATYHLPNLDIQYLGAYQQFHYILLFPAPDDAGVTSFTVSGLIPGANPLGALVCGFSFAAASCEQPLTINPTPDWTLFNEYDQSFSHEIDFKSTSSSRLQYIAGLYWYREHWNQPVVTDVNPRTPQVEHPFYLDFGALGNDLGGGPIVNPLSPAPFNPSMGTSSENTDVVYDSLAAFGQFSYKFNDQFKFTGAVRYTNDHKSGWETWRLIVFDGAILGPLFSSTTYGAKTPAIDITQIAAAFGQFPGTGPTVFQPSTGYAVRRLGAVWDAWTGEADIDWTPNPTTLAYAKYSRGYKSGGWSTFTIIANPETQSEYVDAFEVGAKKTFGSTLTVNGDVFYYNYYNDQVPLNVLQNGQVVGILFNLPLVKDYGVELWGSWRPIDPLTISFTYSYLNTSIAQSPCVQDTVDPLAILPGVNLKGCDQGLFPGTQNIIGHSLPAAVPNKISLNALYTFSFDPGKLTLSGTVVWRDSAFDDVFNRFDSFMPSYTQVNIRAIWTDAKDRYSVILFADNLFDDFTVSGAGGTLVNTTFDQNGNPHEDIVKNVNANAPRTFGIQVQYRWK